MICSDMYRVYIGTKGHRDTHLVYYADDIETAYQYQQDLLDLENKECLCMPDGRKANVVILCNEGGIFDVTESSAA